MTSTQSRPLVFIPTYNERENSERLAKELLALDRDFDILFVDDNSPDGTGDILDKLAKESPRLKVIHRSGKLGIGSAHYDGIRYAYQNGYSTLITMDCDFTHPPEYVPQILDEQAKSDADVVVGSRYMKDNSLPGWNVMRRSLTNLGHIVTQVLLGMKYDATGALRLYRLDRIPAQLFELIHSRGYSFFFESLYILFRNKFSIHEFPISLPARTYGNSKMSFTEIFRSVKLLMQTYLITKFCPEKYELTEPLPDELIDHSKIDTQGWDHYWQEKKDTGGLVYDILATIYRRVLIKPSLQRFTKRYFKPGAKVLHAGCGSGQVDAEIRDYVHIHALDISVNALRFYKKTNGNKCDILHGSIFEIPLPENSMDGVYNLGVMEHFTEEEIQQILAEFRRVLKPGGTMLLFWPPEFGFSVRLFKALTWFSKNILGKVNVKFHPDEITRIHSRSHAVQILKKAGLSMKNYHFGPLDFFTLVVLVADEPVGKSESSAVEERIAS